MRPIFWRTAAACSVWSCISPSEMPNIPIITATNDTPPRRSRKPKVKRSVKVSGSIPTAPMPTPSAPAKMPLTRLPPESEPTRRMPSTPSMK